MVRIERALRPFWLHQVVEYLVGLMLIAAALQSPEPAVPAVLGVVVLGNAAIAIGPAGAFRLVGRKLHRSLDVVVMSLLAVTAFQPWVDVDTTGRLLVGGIALVLFVVWFHTDFADRDERRARRAKRARPQSADIGRQAGRVVGDTVNSVKRIRDEYRSEAGDDRSSSGDQG
mgnify:FL=1